LRRDVAFITIAFTAAFAPCLGRIASRAKHLFIAIHPIVVIADCMTAIFATIALPDVSATRAAGIIAIRYDRRQGAQPLVQWRFFVTRLCRLIANPAS
jgi:hypothetical protein